MADGWYLNTAAGQEGPLEEAEIRRRLAAGEITREFHVWRDGMAAWAPIASVPGLAAPAGPPPAPPPPAAVTPAAAKAASRGGGKGLLVGAIVGVVVLAAGGGAAWWFLAGSRPAPREREEIEVEAEEETTPLGEETDEVAEIEARVLGTDDESAPEAASAGGVGLTRITRSGDEYEVTLNGVLAVRGCRVRSGPSGDFLAFPAERREGEFYPYVRVERGLSDALLAQVRENRAAEGPQGFAKIEVDRVTRLERQQGKTRAFVSFTLDGGAVRLSSWRIVEKEGGGHFLAPPSEKRGEEYVDHVYAPDRPFREALESAALEAFGR